VNRTYFCVFIVYFVAKNLILAGVGTVHLHDEASMSFSDLSSQVCAVARVSFNK
jgi:hypothetical protein